MKFFAIFSKILTGLQILPIQNMTRQLSKIWLSVIRLCLVWCIWGREDIYFVLCGILTHGKAVDKRREAGGSYQNGACADV